MSPSRRSFLGALGAGGLALAGGSCAARGTRGVSQGTAVRPPRQLDSVIRIGSNENPYGPGASALSAIGEALPEANRYAFGALGDTVDAITAHLGVARDHVALGCGSSEVLDAAVSAFTSRESGLVTASPTFELPAERARAAGAPVVEVRVDAHGRLDLDGMLDRVTGSGLVYLCNPNNPTSTSHAAADLQAFIERVRNRSPRTTVLVDEAYHEYVESPAYATAIPLATADPGVIVTRTFSKIHGMAGLRIGYAVGQPATVRRLRPWLGGMTMSVLSAAAARASLADRAHIARQRVLNAEGVHARRVGAQRLHRVRVRREFRHGGRGPRQPSLRVGVRRPASAHRAAVSPARSPRPHRPRHDRRDAPGDGCFCRDPSRPAECDRAVALLR